MNRGNIHIYKIRSFEEYIGFVSGYADDKKIRLYRGQNEDYQYLYPKLLRLVTESGRIKEFHEIERRILDDFKKLSYAFDSKTNNYNDWDILAIAQQHGLPTRLLDWSSNPLTALWFAFESEKDNDEDRIVWGFAIEDDFIVDVENKDPFSGRFIKVFKPKYISPRINAQSSWFSIQNIEIPHGLSEVTGLPDFGDYDS
jgi:hypothetical protein